MTRHESVAAGTGLDEVVQRLRVMQDPTRLAILAHLASAGPVNVTEICGLLGMSQPSVSHHLALLRVSHCADVRREGKHNYYTLNEDFRKSFVVATAGLLYGVTPTVTERGGKLTVSVETKA